MNRLDYLTALRSRIDLEIERETSYQKRMVQFRADYRSHISRASWSERIVAMTAAHFNTSMEAITGTDRTKKVTDARHVAAWLLCDAGRGYSEVGRLLNKDHSSVMYGKKRVDDDVELQDAAKAVKRALHGEDVGAA